MPNFEVDDDLAELVWQLAKPRPFEQVTFSAALRRVLLGANEVSAPVVGSSSPPASVRPSVAQPVIQSSAPHWQKKAPSPDPADWATSVPELRSLRNLNTWQAICDALRIKVAGDSARRKLRNWVRINKPDWPDVPTLEGDA
jgi:hypothetical protein